MSLTRRAWVDWSLFFATRGVAAAIALVTLSRHAGVLNQSPWGGYAEAMRHGQVPYRDFDVLYPPGLLFLSWLGSALPATAFHSAVVVIVLAAEAATFALLGRVRGEGLLDPARAYLLITVLAPLELVELYGLGAFYDSLPAAMLLGSLYLLQKDGAKREVASLGLLAAAILLKTYPIVVAPFILIHIAHRRGWGLGGYQPPGSWRAIARPTVTLAVMVLAPLLALSLIDRRGVLESYSYLGRRAVEWESTPGLFIYLAGGRDVWLWRDADAFTRGLPTFGWGFYAIRGPLDHAAPAAMSLVLVGGMLGAMVLAWRKQLAWSGLVRLSLGAVVLLMLTSRVFSPLYITWLFPLVALTQTDSRRSTRSMFALGTAIATSTTIPTWFAWGITPVGFAMIAARAVIMLTLVAVIALSGRSAFGSRQS